jgi:hypothetical protein
VLATEQANIAQQMQGDLHILVTGKNKVNATLLSTRKWKTNFGFISQIIVEETSVIGATQWLQVVSYPHLLLVYQNYRLKAIWWMDVYWEFAFTCLVLSHHLMKEKRLWLFLQPIQDRVRRPELGT